MKKLLILTLVFLLFVNFTSAITTIRNSGNSSFTSGVDMNNNNIYRVGNMYYAAEVDSLLALQDECSEISGCVVSAITDGNTNWDNSYGFITNDTMNKSITWNDIIAGIPYYVIDWNSTGLIIDWNASGLIKDCGYLSGGVTWVEVTNGTMATVTYVNTQNTSMKNYVDSTFLTSYTETDPYWDGNESLVARIGDCPSGQFVQNTTIGGVECASPSAVSDTNETTRINEIAQTHCAGKVLVGFFTNGTGICEEDNVGAGGGNTTEEMQDAVMSSWGSGLEYNDAGNWGNHSDTSSQASSDNSGNTFIQDITLDTFGHITGLVATAVNFAGYVQWSALWSQVYNETEVNAINQSMENRVTTGLAAQDDTSELTNGAGFYSNSDNANFTQINSTSAWIAGVYYYGNPLWTGNCDLTLNYSKCTNVTGTYIIG